MSVEVKMFGFKPIRLMIIAVTVATMTLVSVPQAAHAGLLGGALVGGGMGALFGGLIGGRRGARVGAAIGGTMGAVRGAANAAARRNAYYNSYYYSPPTQQSPNSYSYTPSSAPGVSGSTLVLETQKELVRHGFDPGKIDGIAGADTKAAIEAYQQKYGLLVTGQSSDPLLKHMLQQQGG